MMAFGLRAWQVSQLGIEHFDEGVYASNYFSSHLDYRYPDRELYAPPLFPALLEWTLILSGGHPHVVMWVNVILGTCLVAAIWWLGLLIGGTDAAFAAATCATFSDFLIQYSRAALTDTPVCLFMVLAICCGLLGLRERHSLWIFSAVIFTGLAWWTKYNGWLPLAILGAGLAGWIIVERPKLKESLPRVAYFLVLSLGGVLFWLPCLGGLQETGGYHAVAQNHAGYVVGFSGWWEGCLRHWQTQQFYSQLSSWGLVVGVLGVQLSRQPRFSRWSLPVWGGLLGVSLIPLVRGEVFLLLLLATVGIISTRLRLGATQRIGYWILLAWLTGLLLTTPLYRPYPRLLLPLWIGILISSGLGVSVLLQKFEGEGNHRCTGARSFMAVIVCVNLLVLFSAKYVSPLYEPRNQFLTIAQAVVEELRRASDGVVRSGEINAIIYVIGEPGLYYQLASLKVEGFEMIAQPAANLGMLTPKPNAPNVPTYLVLGPHAPEEMSRLKQQTEQARFLKEFLYRSSALVLLDDFPPAELEAQQDQRIELWRLIP